MSKNKIQHSKVLNTQNIVDLQEIFEKNKEETINNINVILNTYNSYCNQIEGSPMRVLFCDACIQLMKDMKTDVMMQISARKYTAQDEQWFRYIGENISDGFMSLKIDRDNIAGDMHQEYIHFKKNLHNFHDIGLFLYHYTNLIEKFITSKEEKKELTLSLEGQYIFLSMDYIEKQADIKYREYLGGTRSTYANNNCDTLEQELNLLDFLEDNIKRDFEIPFSNFKKDIKSIRKILEEKDRQLKIKMNTKKDLIG